MNPTTYEHNWNDFDPKQASAADARLVVAFYMGIVHDEAASTEEGRAIFRDVEFCKKYVPGDQTLVIDQPATPTDRVRFAEQYKRFKAGMDEDDQTIGTPLSEWPMLTRGQSEELRYMGIKTVEQLADVRDDVKLKMPGLTQLARQAGIWLGKTHNAAEAAKASKLIDDQQNQIDALQKAVRDLIAKNDKLVERLDSADKAEA